MPGIAANFKGVLYPDFNCREDKTVVRIKLYRSAE